MPLIFEISFSIYNLIMTVPKVFLLGILLAAGYAQITLTSPMSAYMQALGTQVCCTDNTMTIYGSATVQAAPDTATINLQVTVGGSTVNAAVA